MTVQNITEINTSFDRESFVSRLVGLRKSRFETQLQVADAIGYSERQYQDFESPKQGKTALPDLPRFLRLAVHLKTTPTFLLTGVGPAYLGEKTTNTLIRLADRFTDVTDPEFSILVTTILELEPSKLQTLIMMTQVLLKEQNGLLAF